MPPGMIGAVRLAGKTVQFHATVKGIRRKDLPELNDEFAQDLGDYRNLDELRDAFGCGHLRLATEHEVADLFADCELGAMPPMGNGTLYEMPVYCDGLLMAEEAICFNAGTHRDVIRLRVEDWCELVHPRVLAFSAGRAAAARH